MNTFTTLFTGSSGSQKTSAALAASAAYTLFTDQIQTTVTAHITNLAKHRIIPPVTCSDTVLKILNTKINPTKSDVIISYQEYITNSPSILSRRVTSPFPETIIPFAVYKYASKNVFLVSYDNTPDNTFFIVFYLPFTSSQQNPYVVYKYAAYINTFITTILQPNITFILIDWPDDSFPIPTNGTHKLPFRPLQIATISNRFYWLALVSTHTTNTPTNIYIFQTQYTTAFTNHTNAQYLEEIVYRPAETRIVLQTDQRLQSLKWPPSNLNRLVPYSNTTTSEVVVFLCKGNTNTYAKINLDTNVSADLTHEEFYTNMSNYIPLINTTVTTNVLTIKPDVSLTFPVFTHADYNLTLLVHANINPTTPYTTPTCESFFENYTHATRSITDTLYTRRVLSHIVYTHPTDTTLSYVLVMSCQSNHAHQHAFCFIKQANLTNTTVDQLYQCNNGITRTNYASTYKLKSTIPTMQCISIRELYTTTSHHTNTREIVCFDLLFLDTSKTPKQSLTFTQKSIPLVVTTPVETNHIHTAASTFKIASPTLYTPVIERMHGKSTNPLLMYVIRYQQTHDNTITVLAHTTTGGNGTLDYKTLFANPMALSPHIFTDNMNVEIFTSIGAFNKACRKRDTEFKFCITHIQTNNSIIPVETYDLLHHTKPTKERFHRPIVAPPYLLPTTTFPSFTKTIWPMTALTRDTTSNQCKLTEVMKGYTDATMLIFATYNDALDSKTHTGRIYVHDPPSKPVYLSTQSAVVRVAYPTTAMYIAISPTDTPPIYQQLYDKCLDSYTTQCATLPSYTHLKNPAVYACLATISTDSSIQNMYISNDYRYIPTNTTLITTHATDNQQSWSTYWFIPHIADTLYPTLFVNIDDDTTVDARTGTIDAYSPILQKHLSIPFKYYIKIHKPATAQLPNNTLPKKIHVGACVYHTTDKVFGIVHSTTDPCTVYWIDTKVVSSVSQSTLITPQLGISTAGNIHSLLNKLSSTYITKKSEQYGMLSVDMFATVESICPLLNTATKIVAPSSTITYTYPTRCNTRVAHAHSHKHAPALATTFYTNVFSAKMDLPQCIFPAIFPLYGPCMQWHEIPIVIGETGSSTFHNPQTTDDMAHYSYIISKNTLDYINTLNTSVSTNTTDSTVLFTCQTHAAVIAGIKKQPTCVATKDATSPCRCTNQIENKTLLHPNIYASALCKKHKSHYTDKCSFNDGSLTPHKCRARINRHKKCSNKICTPTKRIITCDCSNTTPDCAIVLYKQHAATYAPRVCLFRLTNQCDQTTLSVTLACTTCQQHPDFPSHFTLMMLYPDSCSQLAPDKITLDRSKSIHFQPPCMFPAPSRIIDACIMPSMHFIQTCFTCTRDIYVTTTTENLTSLCLIHYIMACITKLIPCPTKQTTCKASGCAVTNTIAPFYLCHTHLFAYNKQSAKALANISSKYTFTKFYTQDDTLSPIIYKTPVDANQAAFLRTRVQISTIFNPTKVPTNRQPAHQFKPILNTENMFENECHTYKYEKATHSIAAAACSYITCQKIAFVQGPTVTDYNDDDDDGTLCVQAIFMQRHSTKPCHAHLLADLFRSARGMQCLVCDVPDNAPFCKTCTPFVSPNSIATFNTLYKYLSPCITQNPARLYRHLYLDLNHANFITYAVCLANDGTTETACPYQQIDTTHTQFSYPFRIGTHTPVLVCRFHAIAILKSDDKVHSAVKKAIQKTVSKQTCVLSKFDPPGTAHNNTDDDNGWNVCADCFEKFGEHFMSCTATTQVKYTDRIMLNLSITPGDIMANFESYIPQKQLFKRNSTCNYPTDGLFECMPDSTTTPFCCLHAILFQISNPDTTSQPCVENNCTHSQSTPSKTSNILSKFMCSTHHKEIPDQIFNHMLAHYTNYAPASDDDIRKTDLTDFLRYLADSINARSIPTTRLIFTRAHAISPIETANTRTAAFKSLSDTITAINAIPRPKILTVQPKEGTSDKTIHFKCSYALMTNDTATLCPSTTLITEIPTKYPYQIKKSTTKPYNFCLLHFIAYCKRYMRHINNDTSSIINITPADAPYDALDTCIHTTTPFGRCTLPCDVDDCVCVLHDNVDEFLIGIQCIATDENCNRCTHPPAATTDGRVHVLCADHANIATTHTYLAPYKRPNHTAIASNIQPLSLFNAATIAYILTDFGFNDTDDTIMNRIKDDGITIYNNTEITKTTRFTSKLHTTPITNAILLYCLEKTPYYTKPQSKHNAPTEKNYPSDEFISDSNIPEQELTVNLTVESTPTAPLYMIGQATKKQTIHCCARTPLSTINYCWPSKVPALANSSQFYGSRYNTDVGLIPEEIQSDISNQTVHNTTNIPPYCAGHFIKAYYSHPAYITALYKPLTWKSSRICIHPTCTTSIEKTTDKLLCPNHLSEFSEYDSTCSAALGVRTGIIGAVYPLKNYTTIPLTTKSTTNTTPSGSKRP